MWGVVLGTIVFIFIIMVASDYYKYLGLQRKLKKEKNQSLGETANEL